jgi:hypothetical protein
VQSYDEKTYEKESYAWQNKGGLGIEGNRALEIMNVKGKNTLRVARICVCSRSLPKSAQTGLSDF